MIKLVHEFYLARGGYLVNVVEFAQYLEKWLVIIGKSFNELYEHVRQSS